MNLFFFGVYPYICLVLFTLGLIFRYLATPGEWNARSSNLFAKKSLAVGSFIFHYAIIAAFFGHIIGLLIPPAVLGAFGFSMKVHQTVATFAGVIIAPCVIFGLGVLLWRHFASREVWATTVPMDIVVILLIILQGITGGCQDYFGHYNTFTTVGPWIRGVLAGQPDPSLVANAPMYIKCHIICGLAIIACVPFSRLVHFISAPVLWFVKPAIQYRRRYENL